MFEMISNLIHFLIHKLEARWWAVVERFVAAEPDNYGLLSAWMDLHMPEHRLLLLLGRLTKSIMSQAQQDLGDRVEIKEAGE